MAQLFFQVGQGARTATVPESLSSLIFEHGSQRDQQRSASLTTGHLKLSSGPLGVEPWCFHIRWGYLKVATNRNDHTIHILKKCFCICLHQSA